MRCVHGVKIGVYCSACDWNIPSSSNSESMVTRNPAPDAAVPHVTSPSKTFTISSAPSEKHSEAPTVVEIEEFRREHYIHAHPDGKAGLEPWAIRNNVIVDYLCYRATTPLSASAAPTLRWLQENLPWTLPYSEHFEATAYPLDRVKHDVLHVMKSLGRVAAECENHDHGRDRKLYGAALAKEIADFVICALHIAKLEGFDLQDAVIDNSGTRNSVDLRAAISSTASKEGE